MDDELRNMSKEKLIEVIGRLTAIAESLEKEIAWKEVEICQLTEKIAASNAHLRDALKVSSAEKEVLHKKVRSMQRQVRVRKLPRRTRDLILRNS